MKREMKSFHIVGLVSLLMLGLMSFNSQGPVASGHAPAISQSGCVPAPSGLVSWWDADSVSGTTAFDIQDGNDGTLVSGATTAPGMVGQAFSFDGVDDGVRVPASINLSVLSLTIDAWVFPTDNTFMPIVEWNREDQSIGAHLWLYPSASHLYANLIGEGENHAFSASADKRNSLLGHTKATAWPTFRSICPPWSSAAV